MSIKIRQIILFAGDIILVTISLVVTLFLGFWETFNLEIFKEHLFPFYLLYFFWFLLLYIFGLYDLNLIRPKLELLTRSGKCLLACFCIGLIFFYLIPLFGITPKTNLLINILLFGAFTFFWRRVFYSLFSFLYLQNVCFLGKTPLAQDFANTIKSSPQLGYKFVKFLNTNKSLDIQLKKASTKVLIIAKDLAQNNKLTRELYKCLPLKINFINLAQAYEIVFHKIPIDFVNQNWFLENLAKGEKEIYDKFKRISDVLLSSFLILLTSPLWAVIALLIKIDDKGPIFYKQERVGKDRKLFWIWKFRSMLVDAEKTGAKWAEKDDPRVTKVGKIIRKFHLDELPQMFNVLKSDISLVGPRPERPEFVQKLEKEIPHYHLRHLIKPGFTGWAQVTFAKYARNQKDSHEKFQYDLYYIKNRAVFLDLGILLKTFQLFFRKGQ